MKNLLISLLLLVAYSAYGQLNSNVYGLMDVKVINDLANDVNYSKLVRGEAKTMYLENIWDQYLFRDFQEGKLTLSSGKNVTGGKYNYNILNEEVQFILKTDTFSIDNPRQIKTLEISDMKLCYAPYLYDNGVYYAYFEQYNNGKYKLLYKRKLLYVEGTQATGYREATAPHYKTLTEYYVLKENEVALKINTKKELIKYFEQEGIQVKPILKSEKIKFNKPTSLKKLFDKINS